MLALLLALPARGAPEARQTGLTARMVLKVVHPDEVRRTIIDTLDPLGGFPTLVTEKQLILKLPPEKLNDGLELVAKQGLVVEKTMAREDLTQQIAQLEAQLRSKREIFLRLRALIDDSNVQATLQIEKNMASLVREMETIAGRLRVQRERARWAVIDVAFNFRDRHKLVYVRSPFEWINTVDLQAFHRGFFDE